MVSPSALLSEEEMSALRADTDTSAAGARRGLQVVRHDLASDEAAFVFNDATLEMVNERFVRQLRIGLVDVLRTNAKIQIEKARTVPYLSYQQGLKSPLSINTVRINPLRGYSLVVIHPGVIFSALDNFFGGSGSGLGDLAPGRLFTPTETSIIRILLNLIFGALREAWAPILPLDISPVAAEVNPQFVQIADDHERVLVNRFTFCVGGNEEGDISVVIPYTSLKPVRDQLRSRVQSGEENDEKDRVWRRDLQHACQDANMELVAKLARIPMNWQALRQLKVGDTLFFNEHERPWIEVNGFKLFEGEVGAIGNRAAMRIARNIKVN